MTSLMVESLLLPTIQQVTITDDTLSVDVSDGRTISVPWPGIRACCMVRWQNAMTIA